jgi:hypothetical protein
VSAAPLPVTSRTVNASPPVIAGIVTSAMLPRTPVASADDRKPLGVRDVEPDKFRPTTVSHRAPSGDDLRRPSRCHCAGPDRAAV